jgi:hypothetical protein
MSGFFYFTMAAFRKISVSFWSDSFVGELTPEQKYFYLYLMTNDKTTQCGIYETSIRKICFDTGYNSETVQKLIDFFQEKNKIRWSKSTNEIALLNWVKFNDSNSPKVMACVEKELKQVKNRVLIEYLYSMDTYPQEEKEKEKEEEQEEEEVLTFRDELWEIWFKYKSEKKNKYTPMGKAKLFNEWRYKSDEELELAINYSISNNYQGLFAPKKSIESKQQLGKLEQNMISLKNVHDQLTEEIQNGTFVNPYK